VDEALAEQIARLDAIEQIRQLAARYALAVDSRDLETLVQLFIEDVNLGRLGSGRDVLHKDFTRRLRRFTTSIHFVCNHVIDIENPDRATGVVYTRAEHELRGEWIVLALQYWDTYERRDGRWYFARRKAMPWYAIDAADRPNGAIKMRWPDMPHAAPPLPDAWASWGEFWRTEREG
jgi:ketosteroid isomerase-like protein